MTDWARIIGAALESGGETWQQMQRLRQARQEREDELNLRRQQFKAQEDERTTARLERANEQINKMRQLTQQGRLTRSMLEAASGDNPTLKSMVMGLSPMDDRAVGESGLDPDRIAQLIRDTRPAAPKPRRFHYGTDYDPTTGESIEIQTDEDDPAFRSERRFRRPPPQRQAGDGALEVERGLRIEDARRDARAKFADRMVQTFAGQGLSHGSVPAEKHWDPGDLAEARRLGLKLNDYTAAWQRSLVNGNDPDTGEPVRRSKATGEQVPVGRTPAVKGEATDGAEAEYTAAIAAVDARTDVPAARREEAKRRIRELYLAGKGR